MNRKLTREETMKLLFEMSINKYSADEVTEHFLENTEIDTEQIDIDYLRRTLKGIHENLSSIDAKIEEYLQNWKINRLSKINLAILRLCTYELMFEEEIPPAVSINEGVELAKRYSDEKSSSFINGVLDKIAKA